MGEIISLRNCCSSEPVKYSGQARCPYVCDYSSYVLRVVETEELHQTQDSMRIFFILI
jgi:hypothetical protein